MKKILIILPLILLLVSCHNKKTWVLDHRKAPYLYYERDVQCDNKDQTWGYVTFETYMWDEGFPDTIIVKFKESGKFRGFEEAVRRGILEDSLGNPYSPAYVISAYNGDSWVYDIKGKFVKFNKHVNNDPDKDPYIPYNP